MLRSPAGTAQQAFASAFSELELENYLPKIGQRASGQRRADTPESRAARALLRVCCHRYRHTRPRRSSSPGRG